MDWYRESFLQAYRTWPFDDWDSRLVGGFSIIRVRPGRWHLMQITVNGCDYFEVFGTSGRAKKHAESLATTAT